VVRAIGLIEFGRPEVLRMIELPDPVPASGEVRLRVHAATVNPTDAVLRSLRVADVLPAGRASQAHQRLANGGVRGRLVLDLTAI